MAREVITAAGAPEAVGPYSHAVRSGGFVFCSGQVGLDPATGAIVEGGVAAQTTRCLENLAAVAAGAGCDLARDALRMTVYVTDMSAFGDVNAAYGAFFGSEPPARVTIGVVALPLGAEVEIDAVLAAA